MTPQAHNPEIDNAKYVSFVSFRKSGQAVATPVWIAPFEDGYGFTIESTSGKAKRLAHTSRVTIQVCSFKGVITPGATVYNCEASLVMHKRAEEVRDAIARKYGLTYKVFSISLWFKDRFGKSKGLPEAAVILKITQ
jgi:PPOX class probable F420-dependent enzyme